MANSDSKATIAVPYRHRALDKEIEETNRVYIRMGEVGGTMIGDLDSDVVARQFLPVLALRLIEHARACGTTDDMVIEHIGIPPSMWLIGMA